jgi:hypothetical protein
LGLKSRGMIRRVFRTSCLTICEEGFLLLNWLIDTFVTCLLCVFLIVALFKIKVKKVYYMGFYWEYKTKKIKFCIFGRIYPRRWVWASLKTRNHTFSLVWGLNIESWIENGFRVIHRDDSIGWIRIGLRAGWIICGLYRVTALDFLARSEDLRADGRHEEMLFIGLMTLN